MQIPKILIRIYQFAESIEGEAAFWVLSITNWFFADIAYTLLPIGVIIVIRSFISKQSDFLYLSPEWSFATIVTLGAVITAGIELKTEHQKDKSVRLYALTRVLIIFMIFAALILVLVVIRSEGLIIIDDNRLNNVQMALFVSSILVFLMVHIAKEQIDRDKIKLPKQMYAKIYYNSLQENLETVNQKLISTRIALEKRQDMRFNQDSNPERKVGIRERNRDLAQLVLRAEKNLNDLKPFIDELS